MSARRIAGGVARVMGALVLAAVCAASCDETDPVDGGQGGSECEGPPCETCTSTEICDCCGSAYAPTCYDGHWTCGLTCTCATSSTSSATGGTGGQAGAGGGGGVGG